MVKQHPAIENDNSQESTIYNILGHEPRIGISETTLREMTYVTITTAAFPLFAFVNEPVSHLCNGVVRQSVLIAADLMEEQFSVPTNIAEAYEHLNPFVSCVNNILLNYLSPPISAAKLVPNDGDGLVEIRIEAQLQDPLSGAVFHRLHAIDAPELCATHFIKVSNNNVFKQKNGHLSHLAVHYYLRTFASATIHKEQCRLGQGTQVTDNYNRQISSFWFMWKRSPSSEELSVLDEIIKSLLGSEPPVKARIMSNTDPRNATPEEPFLLNLNALLVLSGFCHVFTK